MGGAMAHHRFSVHVAARRAPGVLKRSQRGLVSCIWGVENAEKR